MREVVIIDAVRSPIGRYGGVLASVRPDDLLAHVLITSFLLVLFNFVLFYFLIIHDFGEMTSFVFS